jgi:hypothetical protein
MIRAYQQPSARLGWGVDRHGLLDPFEPLATPPLMRSLDAARRTAFNRPRTDARSASATSRFPRN